MCRNGFCIIWAKISPAIIKSSCAAVCSVFLYKGVKRLSGEVRVYLRSSSRWSNRETVKVGDYLEWTYRVNLKQKKYLRLEYAIHFLRKDGTHHKKVFKISERDFDKGEHQLEKKHSFRIITTRTYYPGTYYVNMRINGKDYEQERFMVRVHS